MPGFKVIDFFVNRKPSAIGLLKNAIFKTINMNVVISLFNLLNQQLLPTCVIDKKLLKPKYS